MAISGVATSTSVPSGNGATSSSPAAPTVDYNQFLKLLVAELRNQDPTSPTDPTQYMSQLASFSSVGQQVQTNATLEALLSAQASTVIGKTLISSDGTISGTVVSVEIASGGGAVATLSDGRHITLGAGVTVSSS
ncbi:flagellar biosynthesis protein FlgD [Beijerinckiaceae bacterium]|nr:flagellar biosynthesis protein FlgD [Beijerinckiaceae bacterium]